MMKNFGAFVTKITDFLVDRRLYIFIITMVFMVASAVAFFFVESTNDLANFLPSDSYMRAGIAVLEDSWGEGMEAGAMRFMLMFENLEDGDWDTINERLQNLPTTNGQGNTLVLEEMNGEIDIVVDSHATHEHYNHGIYTLFVVSVNGVSGVDVGNIMGDHVFFFRSNAGGGFTVHYYQAGLFFQESMMFMIQVAVALMVLVLLIMCESFFDPILIFLGLGVAVVFNLGTNIFMPQMASITVSVGAVLQLILAIVCTMIVLTRYRKEKALLPVANNEQAMKNALRNSAKTILSACIATFVGLLSLLLMEFRVGAHMGIVFSKGVFFTVFSIYTVLPSLILWFDKPATYLEKKVIWEKIKKRRQEKENSALLLQATATEKLEGEVQE